MRPRATRAVSLCSSLAALSMLASPADAALIYSTNFDTYNDGSLSATGQQTAWSGTGGAWMTTGSVNTGQTAFLVAATPAGGSGKSVRMTTEKFNSGGRTKGWLDLSNSGKWAAASTGANAGMNVLRAEASIYVASGQTIGSSYGIMIGDTSFSYSAGMMISNSGQVWTANNGYAAANRTNRTTAALDTWHSFRIDWNTSTGLTQAYLNDALIAEYTPTNKSGVYAVQLFTTTDNGSSGSTTLNGFGWADNYSISSVPAPGALALLGVAGLVGSRRRR
jgi:MYXO-CTERM domain-containing protein